MGVLLLRRQENEYWGARVAAASPASRTEHGETEKCFLSQSYLTVGSELSGSRCELDSTVWRPGQVPKTLRTALVRCASGSCFCRHLRSLSTLSSPSIIPKPSWSFVTPLLGCGKLRCVWAGGDRIFRSETEWQQGGCVSFPKAGRVASVAWQRLAAQCCQRPPEPLGCRLRLLLVAWPLEEIPQQKNVSK